MRVTGVGLAALNHLGVEMPDVDTVDAEQTRFAASGLASVDERGTVCCDAKQDKFWVQGAPNRERWEIYTVLADSPTFTAQDGPTCCATDSADASPEQPAATARASAC